MEKRKSLAHTLLENGRNQLGSPLRRRSSIAVKATSTDLDINDDEAERAALRLESNITTPSSASSRRSLNLGAVTRMSAPQIAEGISECIRLNTQNKINMKNAFSLNMIDFMTYMVRNKDEKISNLQMASQTLDVSAKIYALRVDVLHQDILKMVGNLDPRDKDAANNEGNSDNTISGTGDNSTESQGQKKKKKKKANQKILTTIEDLQGGTDTISLTPIMFGESDCQTSDMLYQAMLPQHCNHGVCLHPYNDVILDTIDTAKTKNADTIEKKITWPPIQLNKNREMSAMFTNFEFLNWSNDEETPQSSQDMSLSSQEHLAFDLDASIPVDDEPTQNNMNFFEMNDDNDESQVGCYAEANAPANIVDINNIINKVPSKNLEYSYFQDALDIRWAGPSHWKIKNVAKTMGTSKIMEACRQDPMRKKKEVVFVYSDEIEEECERKFAKTGKGKAKLRVKTAKNVWSEEKITLPPETHEDNKKLMCKYYLRPDDIVNFVRQSDDDVTVVSEGAVDDYNYGNDNDTIDYCPNLETDDQPQADDDIVNDFPYDTEATQGGFVGSNLVEAPKLTQKIYIPFSQRAKKMDMRHLKKSIWKSLATKVDVDKENFELNDAEQLATMTVKEPKHFSDIFTDLPSKLTKNDAEELSFPIAFVSLLHLANEKCLKVLPSDNLSDLTIMQDSL